MEKSKIKIPTSIPTGYLIDKSMSYHQVGSVARTVTLVDAVFAIAMTLLVFDLKETDITGLVHGTVTLRDYLLANWTYFLSFTINFLLLAQLWVSHVVQSKYLRVTDHAILWENIMFLLPVSVVPYSAWLLGQAPFSEGILILYGVNILAAWFFDFMIWRHLMKNFKSLGIGVISRKSVRLGYHTSYINIGIYSAGIIFAKIFPLLSTVIFVIGPLPFIFGLVYWLKKR